MQIVEELNLARSNRQLLVNVEKSYGELTSMDVDPADEGATAALSNVTEGWMGVQEMHNQGRV